MKKMMSKGKKVNGIIIITIIIIIVGALGISYIFLKSDTTNFNGRYYRLNPPESPSYYEIIPDKANPMEGSYYYENDTNEDFDTYQTEFGYRIEEGKVIMSGDIAYTFYKNYLIPEEYTFSGSIPDEDTFDAVCEYISETGFSLKIEFKNDGTVESTSYEKEETLKSSGTYERSGDIITCEYGDSWPSRYLIYKNQINGSVLYKKN